MEKNSKHIFVLPAEAALVEAVAEKIVTTAVQAVAERGRFVLSLSGGQTPRHLYAMLARPPYSDRMPWEKTFIFWGDERCVPATDDDNNAHMARTALLSHVPIPAVNVFPVQTYMSPADAAEDYEQTICRFFGKDLPFFDIVLLGLGANGHTASLFPGTTVLNEQERLVKEVYVAEEYRYRISMTAILINQARCVLFLVEGTAKAEIVQQILEPGNAAERYPAQLIQPQHGELAWYLDKNAASLLHAGYANL